MEINNIIDSVLFRYPLFGNVIVNLKIKHTTENVPAPAFTDGKVIYYKDEFLTDYDDEEKEFIISHEIFHIILNHFFRNIGRDPELLNYVEDAIINQLLIRDGLKMPKGLILVEDALDYSVEELYMKYLPEINNIKKFMSTNTYHIDLSTIGEIIEHSKNEDIQELMDINNELRDYLLEDYMLDLARSARETKKATHGIATLGIEIPAEEVGTEKPLLKWQDILEENLKVPDDDATSFYEVQMDGIIKKEVKIVENKFESEIIVDSSGSMDIELIKIVLRECKNILLCSDIKVGFCDTKFYGWNDIKTNDDIDNLNIIGRGGTKFDVMVDSFSENIDNKVVITDGYGVFPQNRPDILWIIIATNKPYFLSPERIEMNEMYSIETNIENINYIFIDKRSLVDTRDCVNNKKFKKLILNKKRNN